MTTFKVHERYENRDDAMVVEAETAAHAAEDYARRFLQVQLERYGSEVLTSDYEILVRVPGGNPTRFRAHPTRNGDVAVRPVHDN